MYISTPAPPELSSGETTPSNAIAGDGIDRRNFLGCMAGVGTCATSTAFPRLAPGAVPNAGPMFVPAGKLGSVLGATNVEYFAKHRHLAIIDSSLADKV